MRIETADNHPLFEIDQADVYGQFFLTNSTEIAAYLQALQKQRAIIAIYINVGEPFFLSTILEIDENKSGFLLDLANGKDIHRLVESSAVITLTATLDKVKIQIRAEQQKIEQLAGSPVLRLPMPKKLLRLQRREFFRLETSHANPLRCKLAKEYEDGAIRSFELKLLDISGGGVGLIAPIELAEHFATGSIFPECRLEIPDDGFIPVNLCAKKIIKQENRTGQSYLRIGCEFVNLPGNRLSQIQRYITRIERERKARGA